MSTFVPGQTQYECLYPGHMGFSTFAAETHNMSAFTPGHTPYEYFHPRANTICVCCPPGTPNMSAFIAEHT